MPKQKKEFSVDSVLRYCKCEYKIERNKEDAKLQTVTFTRMSNDCPLHSPDERFDLPETL